MMCLSCLVFLDLQSDLNTHSVYFGTCDLIWIQRFVLFCFFIKFIFHCSPFSSACVFSCNVLPMCFIRFVLEASFLLKNLITNSYGVVLIFVCLMERGRKSLHILFLIVSQLINFCLKNRLIIINRSIILKFDWLALSFIHENDDDELVFSLFFFIYLNTRETFSFD